jgi:protein involved in ribonucleotide reduction
LGDGGSVTGDGERFVRRLGFEKIEVEGARQFRLTQTRWKQVRALLMSERR